MSWVDNPWMGLSSKERFFVRSRLRAMGLRSLRDYYRTAHWRATARRWRKKTCGRCGKGPRAGLQLHHKTYERLGRELQSDLETLCDGCHRKEHGLPPRRRRRRKKR